MMAIRWPAWMTSPTATLTSVTVPPTSASTDLHLHRFEKHQDVAGTDPVAPADHDFEHTGNDLSAHILGHTPIEPQHR